MIPYNALKAAYDTCIINASDDAPDARLWACAAADIKKILFPKPRVVELVPVEAAPTVWPTFDELFGDPS